MKHLFLLNFQADPVLVLLGELGTIGLVIVWTSLEKDFNILQVLPFDMTLSITGV